MNNKRNANVVSINRLTVPGLENKLYALKRRADLLAMIVERKLEGRISNKWCEIYTEISCCLEKIDGLPYLISDKEFPESHNIISTPKRITFAYIGRKFKEIVETNDELYKNANDFLKELLIDLSLHQLIRPEISYNEWLDNLEEVNYYINDTKVIFQDKIVL